MFKNLIGLFGAGAGLVCFLAVNLLAYGFLGSFRLDATEEKLFTLSEGSKNITRELDEPIRLYFYFSEKSGRAVPEVVAYKERVLDMLEEYVRNADGKLILEVRDPEPYSEDEELAVADGIQGIPIGPDPLYFGLVGTNATDDTEVIPFFGDISRGALDFTSKERFLEYDLSRLIYALAHPEKPRVGLMSVLELSGGPPPNPMNPMAQRPAPPWKFVDELRRFFDVIDVETTVEELPEDLDALVLVQPRQLPETTLYAIDQYVMGGGKLIAFVDPFCEADEGAGDPMNPMGNMGASRASDLNRLFAAWGFEMTSNVVVLDRATAVRGTVRDAQGGLREMAVPFYLTLTRDALADEDPVTSLLDTVRVGMAGSLHPVEGATTTFEPLVQTSDEAMELDATRLQFRPDLVELLETYVAGGEPKTLAARVSGEAKSAFPEGAPGSSGLDGDGEDGEEAGASGHRATSDGSIQVIAFSDADMLQDRWWIQESRLGQFSLGWMKTSDNVDLLTNALGNMTGGEDLISIRARGRFARPFDRVNEIRTEAEARYFSEEQELQRAMENAEREIAAIQNQRDSQLEGVDGAGNLLLAPEIQQRYEEFLEERASIGRRLRDVQHERDKEIERLGARLKAANMFGVPAVVTALAVILAVVRRQRQGT